MRGIRTKTATPRARSTFCRSAIASTKNSRNKSPLPVAACAIAGVRMKKSFPLHVRGKADARVLDAIKHEVRKYIRRELKKPLPEDAARWTFACRVGADETAAQPSQLKDIAAAIDAVAN